MLQYQNIDGVRRDLFFSYQYIQSNRIPKFRSSGLRLFFFFLVILFMDIQNYIKSSHEENVTSSFRILSLIPRPWEQSRAFQRGSEGSYYYSNRKSSRSDPSIDILASASERTRRIQPQASAGAQQLPRSLPFEWNKVLRHPGTLVLSLRSLSHIPTYGVTEKRKSPP